MLCSIAALASLLAAACTDSPVTSPLRSPRDASLDRAQPTFVITTIDVPGALSTVLEGINAGGDISGFFVSSDGKNHGLVLSSGTFTTIDYPGAGYTDVRGIGPDGSVVGTFANTGEEAVAFHGFRRTAAGEFVAVHYPGHLYEIPQRILPDGTILGCRHDHDLMGSMDGVVMSLGGDSEIGMFASMNDGATPDLSRIVGQRLNMALNRTEGFVIDNGVFTPLVVPGSIQTVAWDVNPRGDVVGVYRNAAGFHGFMLTEDGFTTIDVAGATATRAFGVNARGDVVGAFVAAGKTHGFLARRTH
jgi:uncharacterized membrane protein